MQTGRYLPGVYRNITRSCTEHRTSLEDGKSLEGILKLDGTKLSDIVNNVSSNIIAALIVRCSYFKKNDSPMKTMR
jgi:hypothetical protein